MQKTGYGGIPYCSWQKDYIKINVINQPYMIHDIVLAFCLSSLLRWNAMMLSFLFLSFALGRREENGWCSLVSALEKFLSGRDEGVFLCRGRREEKKGDLSFFFSVFRRKKKRNAVPFLEEEKKKNGKKKKKRTGVLFNSGFRYAFCSSLR